MPTKTPFIIYHKQSGRIVMSASLENPNPTPALGAGVYDEADLEIILGVEANTVTHWVDIDLPTPAISPKTVGSPFFVDLHQASIGENVTITLDIPGEVVIEPGEYLEMMPEGAHTYAFQTESDYYITFRPAKAKYMDETEVFVVEVT